MNKKGSMIPQNMADLTPEVKFGLNLTERIRESVMPVYGIKQKNVPIHAVSHDYNFAVDFQSEKEIRKVFKDAWKHDKMYGYATEDQGLVLPERGRLDFIFLIDPVDGSRPAQVGFENACVTLVGVRGNKLEATFKDIEFGIIHALKENLTYVVLKRKGVFRIEGQALQKVERRKDAPTELKDCSLVYETYTASAEYVGKVLDPLIYEVNFSMQIPSASYFAFSLVRGQNELHVDIRRRLFDDYSNLPIVQKISPKFLSPMDIAAGWLMIKELGGKVTDGYGRLLDDVRLWLFDEKGTWSPLNQISWIGAITEGLYTKAYAKIEEGFAKLPKS